MRLVYILAATIAATLYSDGSAFTTTNSNRAVISDVDTAYPIDGTQESDGRALRPVSAEGRIDEERSFMDVLKYLKTSITKRIPGTATNKMYKAGNKRKRENERLKRVRSNIRHAMS
ncbi:hypothetical protein PHYSODRAFT_286184 [Phytophthora sojae]|uniref:RxLR effector protein n=2 Tax=Phytophthora sojae TaxID=67593 RepID=G4ZMV3_PHYSP|nr:hypothetical protein PHYSODRAFT_286184 [Phytophthora sojae]AEK80918.1 Avh207 [Phytophthora sojae]AEK80919.1 Avh207 [Phytophthora sojae]AEK80920.1 Avh207 [Phytophthora sojae]EGZ14676.1 hypothetical protein PHYSODRAFT_286184 [Phytophthora sojae]|eukprot:XP_009528425.1 hypothetical protein PHYSODRAFT_286184 [Phytophthora sojae]